MSHSQPSWSLRRDPEFFQRAPRNGNLQFVVYFEADTNLPKPIIRVVVPKTVANLAVTRNKLKRQTKNLLTQMKLPPGKLVIVAKFGALQATYPDLRSSLTHVLKKVLV